MVFVLYGQVTAFTVLLSGQSNTTGRYDKLHFCLFFFSSSFSSFDGSKIVSDGLQKG